MVFPKKLPEKNVLQKRIEGYWRETAYITDAKRLTRMRKYLIQARKHLDNDELSEGFDAYYQAKREYILARKYRQIYYRRSWFGMQCALMLVVVFSIGILGLWLRKDALPLNAAAPFFAALGGGIGGCAAVLIQVIDVDPDSEAVSKWPWYVIKPTLGVALGFVTYFAVVSGLNVLANDVTVGNFEGIVVIGFLAGFFESFSTGVLARLAGQFTNNQKKDQSTDRDDDEEDVDD